MVQASLTGDRASHASMSGVKTNNCAGSCPQPVRLTYWRQSRVQAKRATCLTRC